MWRKSPAIDHPQFNGIKEPLQNAFIGVSSNYYEEGAGSGFVEVTPRPPQQDESHPAPSPNSINEVVWFKTLKDTPQFCGIDGEVYELKAGDFVSLPKINAEILQKGGFGYIVTDPDVIVRERFLKRVKVEHGNTFSSSSTILDDDGRKTVHLDYAITREPKHHHESDLKEEVIDLYLDRLNDLQIEEFIYSEHYTDIEPSERLIELAKKIGFYESEFYGKVEEYYSYKCQNGHIVHAPVVWGSYLNPYLRQRGSKESGRQLALKLIQLDEEAKVLERDRKTGVLKELTKNNLYVLPMELTYPPELDDLFIHMLKENPQKLSELREKAVNEFFKRLCAIEFGEYALWSDFIFWFNLHDWSSKMPNKPNFHEHINLIDVCFDWRGSDDYKELYDACKSFLTPSVNDIANKTGWSPAKVKRLLSFFIGKGLVLKCGSGKKVFFDCLFAPIPSPLIRFNPKRFSADKKDQYNHIWKEVIKEVFRVEVKEAIVHLPDEVIVLKPSNLPDLIHRLGYCNRHPITDVNNFLKQNPKADFDEFWLRHLLNFKPRLRGNKIAKRLSIYTGIEFLSTLKGRYSREKAKLDDLVKKRFELEEELKELIHQKHVLKVEGLDDSITFYELDKEIERVKSEIEKLEEELKELDELRERIKKLKEKYHVNLTCPICGGELTPIGKIESLLDCPLIYFDPVTKKWVLKVKRRR